MKLPLHSLRWRLQLWHGLLLFVVLLGYCLTAYQLSWNNQSRRTARSVFDLEHRLFKPLFEAARSPEADEDQPVAPIAVLERLREGQITLPPEVLERFQGREPGYAYFVIYDDDGRILLRSANLPADLEPLPGEPGYYKEDMRWVGERREMARRSPRGPSSIVGRDASPELDDIRRFAWSLGASAVAVWLVGLAGGWWLAGRTMKPIRAISATATRIAEGNLAERIETKGQSELDDLARVLNHSFERLHASFERQKRFTADASHELRTPVTILLTETERILRRERSPAEYREALQTCHDSAVRMRTLIEALLLLARQENAPPPQDHLDLADIAREVCRQLTPLATSRQVELRCQLEKAPCRGEATALTILATNLVANAIQHHRAGGYVDVTTGLDSGGTYLRVRDNGPGIDPEHLPHIFERFYRADAARTGSSGHTGLGLAIARTIADNHQGRLTATSERQGDACFTLRLPV